jgi:hypothetical protein
MTLNTNQFPEWHNQEVQIQGIARRLGDVAPRLFHGSPDEIEPGTILTPGTRPPRFKDSPKEAISISGEEGNARYWASVGPPPKGKRKPVPHGGPAHVYEVEPIGEVGSWRATPGALLEGRVKSAKVIRKVERER